MTMRWLQDPEIPELPSEADSPVLQLSNIVTDEDIKDDEAIAEGEDPDIHGEHEGHRVKQHDDDITIILWVISQASSGQSQSQ